VSSTSTAGFEGDVTGITSAQVRIRELAASQIENYLRQPAELVGHFSREVSALDGYRGRQLLELLQNADDAGVNAPTGCTLLLSLSRQRPVMPRRISQPKGRRAFQRPQSIRCGFFARRAEHRSWSFPTKRGRVAERSPESAPRSC
jgi:hypothetical protein